MLRVKSKVNSRRRAGTLRPKDYDHEIDLVDHDGSAARAQQRLSRDDETANVSRSSTNAELLQHRGEETRTDEEQTNDSPNGTRVNSGSRPDAGRPSNELEHEASLPHDALRPQISVQEPSPNVFHGNVANVKPKKPRIERETVIDILYENERGGFLCGAALFSEAALGGLDATPWTNAYHKPSPTSIRTATVPDPSWEWVWPEWRINHQDGMDEGGWEYSFAYSKKFSWHGPKWWNSFVRRRAWIRKRAKKQTDDMSSDMHMHNTDYFLIRPASTRTKQSHGSLAASSKAPSKAPSMSQVSSVSGEPVELPDIQDVETLMQILRKARIDREKLEAAENYLDNGLDLEQLQEVMHEIMGTFVFQASRRLLLSRLMQIYDSTTEELEKQKEEGETGLGDRREALRQAVKHADEEVRKLAYWSDVKQMAESGESKGAAEEGKGWDDTWEGIDQSGPGEPLKGKLPSS